METSLKEIDFQLKQLEGLPLFLKRIYFNEMVNIQDENKLMRFNKSLKTSQMRHYEPSRIICKFIDTDNFKGNNDEL